MKFAGGVPNCLNGRLPHALCRMGEEALKDGIPAEDFDAIVRPEKMIGPG